MRARVNVTAAWSHGLLGALREVPAGTKASCQKDILRAMAVTGAGRHILEYRSCARIDIRRVTPFVGKFLSRAVLASSEDFGALGAPVRFAGREISVTRAARPRDRAGRSLQHTVDSRRKIEAEAK